MRSIAIDLGNTRAKVALFEDTKLVRLESGLEISAITDWCRRQQAQYAIVASVGVSPEPVVASLSPFLQTLLLQPGLPLPIQVAYKTPQTLGADRIAAAVGGAAYCAGKPVLVFDAGTCLTHEFVTQEGNYLGGAISPGLHMRLRAMHSFTARLPLIALEQGEEPPITGQSTAECLQSGAYWGMLGEIESTILRYRKISPHLSVILCGGDAKTFENKLKGSIFVVSELVLFGLNEILRYNVLQKKSSAPAV
ncbi:type III pantothenate kinase [Cesiribacter sp. SM1]|uniref:type III pantothenate kinase n=1 Tax=Cesiribacter sp. SM1 TaxID=2861196 RepID=UPI001CD62EC4|nr:type III pantothenate kinase [Cesiribacter sp. SM1]